MGSEVHTTKSTASVENDKAGTTVVAILVVGGLLVYQFRRIVRTLYTLIILPVWEATLFMFSFVPIGVFLCFCCAISEITITLKVLLWILGAAVSTWIASEMADWICVYAHAIALIIGYRLMTSNQRFNLRGYGAGDYLYSKLQRKNGRLLRMATLFSWEGRDRHWITEDLKDGLFYYDYYVGVVL